MKLYEEFFIQMNKIQVIVVDNIDIFIYKSLLACTHENENTNEE